MSVVGDTGNDATELRLDAPSYEILITSLVLPLRGCLGRTEFSMRTDLPLPDEPKGWRKLQQEALAERDTKKLDGLLRSMYQILTQHEYETEKKRIVDSVD
jgi:hypothetical protein